MLENFKKYIKKEREILETAEKERQKEEKEKRLAEKAELRRLQIQAELQEMAEKIIDKYPDNFQMQSYIKYLRKEVARMKGFKLEGLKIISTKNNREQAGHIWEEEILSNINLDPRQIIPVLVNKDVYFKEQVLPDLLEFYSHPILQKKEECQLGRFGRRYLENLLTKQGLEFKEVVFKTGVGSQLDFSFGIDGWVEIRLKNGQIERVCFDLKTNPNSREVPGFADLILKIQPNRDEINLESQNNILAIKKFLDQVVDIFKQKIKK